MSTPKEIFRSHTEVYQQKTYAAISPTRPELSTKGKTAVVTGAGTGIGASIAKSLAESGVSTLALLGRTEKTLAQTQQAVEKISAGTKVLTYIVDITDAAVVHISTAAVHMAYLPGYSSYCGSKIGATKVFEYFGLEHPELRTFQIHPGLILETVMAGKLGDSLKWYEAFADDAMFFYFHFSSWQRAG